MPDTGLSPECALETGALDHCTKLESRAAGGRRLRRGAVDPRGALALSAGVLSQPALAGQSGYGQGHVSGPHARARAHARTHMDAARRSQFKEKGYFVVEDAVSPEHLAALNEEYTARSSAFVFLSVFVCVRARVHVRQCACMQRACVRACVRSCAAVMCVAFSVSLSPSVYLVSAASFVQEIYWSSRSRYSRRIADEISPTAADGPCDRPRIVC